MLVDCLREDLGLTGTHIGCEHGVCGTCTVLVNGETVRSCLMLAVQADGATITTVEGLAADGQMNPLQQAFREAQGLQCGFCTPGMLMLATELLGENPRRARTEIREAISANLCRCTGYRASSRRSSSRRRAEGEGHGHDSTHLDRQGRAASGRSPPADGARHYTDDVRLAGMAHAAVLRSPQAHARIVRIDTSRARTLPGVFAVITGEDAKELSNPLPAFCAEPVVQYALAVDKVRYAGEAVAAVAAVDRYTAEDAAALIDVEYAPLPVLTDPLEAMKPSAPKVHDNLPSNLVFEKTMTFGDVAGGFASADRVIRRRLRWHRASAQPLETAGAVCRFNPASGRMDVWSNTNMINYVGWLVANTLKVAPSKLSINPMDVGGSFGSKHVLGKVIGIAAMLAKRAGRAVKFMEDRVDNLTACENLACDRFYGVELAVTADGIFTGLRIKVVDDYGAYFQFGHGTHGNALAQATGPYRIPGFEYTVQCVLTNKCQQGVFRGAGSDANNFALERLVDAAAQELGLDRVEIRRRNFIQPDAFPFKMPAGNIYDSGDYPKVPRPGAHHGGLVRAQEDAGRGARAGTAGRHRPGHRAAAQRLRADRVLVLVRRRRSHQRARERRPLSRSDGRVHRHDVLAILGQQPRDGRGPERGRGVRHRSIERQRHLRIRCTGCRAPAPVAAHDGHAHGRRRRRGAQAEGQDVAHRGEDARSCAGRHRLRSQLARASAAWPTRLLATPKSGSRPTGSSSTCRRAWRAGWRRGTRTTIRI